MKKISLLLLNAAMLICGNALAQRTDTAKTDRWWMHTKAGAAQVQVTYRQTDISGLNTALQANGLKPISIEKCSGKTSRLLPRNGPR